NHLLFKLLDQWLKSIVSDVGCCTIPRDHQAEFVQEETQLPTDNPSVIRFPFFAYLVGATPFTNRMDQLNAIGINDPKDGGFGQEPLGPLVMGFEQAKYTWALWPEFAVARYTDQ